MITIARADIDCYMNSIGGYDADTDVSERSIPTAVREDRKWIEGDRAYAIPNPKIPVNISLLRIAICRPHSVGIGSSTTVISKRMLTTALNKSSTA